MSKFDLETLLFSSEKNHLTQLTLLAYLHTSGVNHQQDMVGFDKAKIKKMRLYKTKQLYHHLSSGTSKLFQLVILL